MAAPRGASAERKLVADPAATNARLRIKYTTAHLLFLNTNNTYPHSLQQPTKKTLTMSAIPTSTSVSESAVIRAPLSAVWHLIKIQDFSKFWSALKASEYVKGASEETDIVKWTFKDGSEVEVKQEEHSVCQHFFH
jgi:hypothetical protein